TFGNISVGNANVGLVALVPNILVVAVGAAVERALGHGPGSTGPGSGGARAASGRVDSSPR
ncbi:MAG: hypothetical protein J2P20_21450, partial [Pseudonocardia sp.]|nr:hypothetical protein [Pseudonocardia sp.]